MVSVKKIRVAYLALFVGAFLWSCEEYIPDDPNNPNDTKGGEGGTVRYYLGYGYDVINSAYINRNDIKVSRPILDQQKMIKDGMFLSEPTGIQDFQTSVGSSISKFYAELVAAERRFT